MPDDPLRTEALPRFRAIEANLRHYAETGKPVPPSLAKVMADVLDAGIRWATDPEAMASAAGMR